MTSEQVTILIVDDDPRIVEVLREGLEVLGGFRVASAADGEQGLERFEEVRPHAVIIDVRMPGIDGYQLARAIRGDPATAQTPLVFLTAMAQDRDRYIGLASGADIYLIKPVAPSELVEAIRGALALDADGRLRRMRDMAQGDSA
ncbi:MAG TPA: response regulator [Ktedonobacterales bacterium]|nr:response regulator [Ktedonobacterales bacterium]